MKVSEITKQLDYDYVGDDYEILGISFYNDASEDDLTIAFSRDEINKTKAKVVLTSPVILETSKTLIMVHDSIDLAMIKVCNLLMREGILPDYSSKCKYTIADEGYRFGENCNIDSSAQIDPYVVIGRDVVIGKQCKIEAFSVINSGSIIEDDVRIGSGCKIGAESLYHYQGDNGELRQFIGCGKTIIKKGTQIGNNTIIQRGTLSDTVIGEFNLIGNGIDIGHDVNIGNNCKIVSQTGIAGGAVLKNDVIVYGQAGIANNITIGNHAVVKAKTLVSKSVKDYETVFGIFGRNYSEEMKLVVKMRRFFGRKDE